MGHGKPWPLNAPLQRQEKDTRNLMKQRRPYLGVGLAMWLGYSAAAIAQGEFYIELRGPESAEPARANAPAAVQQSANPAPASVQPAASPGRYGPIRSTDTLWAIAARYTRAPTTVQQTMVAMYHLNPQAFVRGNINYLQRGAQLRLPTVTQARQRSAQEAEAEFRRLSRQGSRSRTRVAAAPAPATPTPVVASRPVAQPEAKPETKPEAKPAASPVAPVEQSAPVAATPPVPVSQSSETQTAAPANGLSEPKAAPVPVAAPSPEQAEDAAMNRLQLQLMDELREQVAMSNEQLASLADNNQALRQRLTQLTAEVEDLKVSRQAEPLNAQDNKPDEIKSEKGWLSELLNSPLNLALILILPALLLLALFTLWWRNRERRNLAEQEQELSETSAMLDDERDEFEDLFATESDNTPLTEESENNIPEQDVDEDAFARFLEEQQLLEEQEAQRLQPTPEENEEPDLSDALFNDEAQFDDEAQMKGEGLADDDQPVSNDDIDDLFGESSVTAEPEVVALDEDALFDDEALLAAGDDAVSNDDIDDLFSDTAVTASDADVPDNLSQMDDAEQATTTAATGTAEDAYVSVDKLMADAELGDGPDPELERKLDLELDDYANVIGQGDGVDIDADEGGIGAQLDLARAYIEIDDIDSARELLNEAIERGNEAQQRDAQKLLQRLAKLG